MTLNTMIRFEDDVAAILQATAQQKRRSMNKIVNDVLREHFAPEPELIPAAEWERYGFEEVHESVPGRLYEVWADMTCYRIAIHRAILSGSTITWNSSIDRLATTAEPVDVHHSDSTRVWTNPMQIADRLRGETPAEAIHDAARWLAEYAGVDPISRARRDAEGAAQMDPQLRRVVDAISSALANNSAVLDTWRDQHRSRWSTRLRDFYVARDGKGFALSVYRTNSMQQIERTHYALAPAGARLAAEHIADVIEAAGQPFHAVSYQLVTKTPDKFRGPYSVIEVESIAGEFTEVLMKPIAPLALKLSNPDDKILTTVGYRWPCGCETRGTASPAHLPTVIWAACAAHDASRDERPVRMIPRGFEDASYIVRREDATLESGQMLIAPRATAES